LVSINTVVDEESADSFVVTVNGQVMVDPVRRPLLSDDDFLVKQMTNFFIVVSSPGFRLEFDVLSRIYVRLDPRFENKVLQCFYTCCCCCCCCYSLLGDVVVRASDL